MLRFIPLFFLLVSICPVLSAKEIAVGQLVSDHLDTESSTNVAFNVRRNDVKVFDVRIEQASSVSNCVQVAFGRDADADGDLSPDEADLVLGWRAGRTTTRCWAWGSPSRPARRCLSTTASRG